MTATRPEHKKELHEKIEHRTAELKASLAHLQSDPKKAKSDRARAVEEALAALETHMGGGWDKIDESESAALSRWLETSRFLFDEQPASQLITPPTPPSTLRLPS
jgi:hypothetical protein